MFRNCVLLAAAVLLVCPMAPGAAGQDAEKGDDAAAKAKQQQINEEISLNPYGRREWWLRDYPMPAAGYSAAVARFGYWGTSVEGNRSITGLYEDLSPSPFWDFDGITSDGFSTVDYSISQLNETGFNGDIYYYRPDFSADLDFDSFLKQMDQTPLRGFHEEDSPFPVMTNRLILDHDTAIRVEEVEARFKGRLTKNIRWNFDFYNLHRHGQRQVTSMAHCADMQTAAVPPVNFNVCHVTNQSQRIDWNVARFEPGLEGKWGPVTINYTREMRVFSTDDENVTAPFNHTFSGFNLGTAPVAVVPESFTQFDKIKLRADLTEKTAFYGFGYVGNTENKFRDFERDYWGYDLRLISRVSRGFTLTGYFSENAQNADKPPTALTDQGETSVANLRSNVDYDRTRTGVRGSWKPSEYFCASAFDGVVFASGYQYSHIDRDDVTYEVGNGTFEIPDTRENKLYADLSKRWNPKWSTFVRYTLRVIDDPLVGLRLSDANYPDDTSTFSNTNLPEHVNLVELGATWMPVENFVATAQVGLEQQSHDSEYANFTEDSYPFTLTAWYAPSCKWTLSAGMGYYTNWIDQDITVGFRDSGFPAFTENWSYGGRTQVYNVGARYAYTQRLFFNGNVEWLRGVNTFNAVSPPDTTLQYAEDVAGIIVEQTRVSFGVDYVLNNRFTTFARYIVKDFEDIDNGWDSGTAHMVLGGLSATF